MNGENDDAQMMMKPINSTKQEDNKTTENSTIPSRKSSGTGSRRHRKALRDTSAPRSDSPESVRRVPPRIHSKLYCEQVKKIKRTPSTVLNKLNDDELKSVTTHAELAETANGVRMLARNLTKATIHIDVKTIMIVTKAKDNNLIYLTREVTEWFLKRNKVITVYVDSKLAYLKRFDYEGLLKTIPCAKPHLKFWDKKFTSDNAEIFDMVLTLGGDGTVLYVSNLFQRIVPPVISFSLGSLGFLTNFEFESFRATMLHILENGVKANLRMRFTCRVHKLDGELVCEQQVLNELVVDRGPSPFVTNLELYGDGNLLTIAQADGLIIATPTGSTAYSLSAGGSLVHPGVSAISVTPICPHTLSFRPILLPDGMFLKVKVPSTSRLTAWASFDGKVRTELSQGDYVTIQASPFPFPTVISSKTEYIDSVSRNLHWNVRKQQRPFLDYKLNGSHEDNLEKRFDNLFIDDADQYDIDESEEEANSSQTNITSNNNASSTNTSTISSTADNNTTKLKIESFKDPNEYPSDKLSITSTPSDEDSPYIPGFGAGLSTPPSHTISFTNLEDRHCFAHPNAKVTFGSFSETSTSSNSNSVD